jgi:glutaconate CoA-transferase, subunit A
VLLPAIKPDVALFHAPLADRAGNVWQNSPRPESRMLATRTKAAIAGAAGI